MPQTERVMALVLERQHYQDYDRLYTLLTAEHGLVRARARGASKPLAKVRPHVEGFGLVDVMLVKGRAGYLLISAEMQEPIRIASTEAHLLAVAARRVFARILREQVPDQDLFGLLLDLLRDLASWKGKEKRELLAREWHFFWSLLGAMGYNGESERCNLCQAPLTGEARFVPLAGSFFCLGCAKHNGLSASAATRTFLQRPFSFESIPADLAQIGSGIAEHFEHRLDLKYPRLA